MYAAIEGPGVGILGAMEVPRIPRGSTCLEGSLHAGDPDDIRINTRDSDGSRIRLAVIGRLFTNPGPEMHDLSNPTQPQYLAHVATIDHYQLDQYTTPEGMPVQTGYYVTDPLSAPYKAYTFPGGSYNRDNYAKVCGPILELDTGQRVLIVKSFQRVTPPWLIPPQPITISGPVSRDITAGVTQAWPLVDGHRVTTSRRWPSPAANKFAQDWAAGQLPTGTTVQIHGYPIDTGTGRAIVPIEYQILSAAPEPTADSSPDPVVPGAVDVELTETEMPDFPDPATPDQDHQEGPGQLHPDLRDLDLIPVTDPATTPGNGTGPGAADGPQIAQAGFGGAAGAVIVGLLLFPFFFGKDRKK